MDGGPEAITDEVEREALRAQARGVRLRSAVLAAVLTAIVWALP